MTKKNINIWIWLQNDRIFKAIFRVDEGTLKIYDENDCLIMKRTGLTKVQIKKIEINFIQHGAKKLGGRPEPFKFL